ncbi:MAG: amino acid ABC transporter permease [Acidimicrobiia bacterium]|nr:amino acid ABC transporter permease [Acidimicrobiia bacterium]
MVTWLRKNLFRSVGDSITTIVIGSLAIWVLYRFLRFVFVTGRWEIVRTNLSLFITGSWPEDELWRVVVAIVAVSFMAGLIAGFIARQRREEVPDDAEPGRPWLLDILSRTWPLLLTVLLLLSLAQTVGPWLLAVGSLAAFAAGRFIGPLLPRRSGAALVVAALVVGLSAVWLLVAGVEFDSWGGLLLNLFLAAISIALCFPLGVLLALGRRSQFPILRTMSTSYIELFRGVPLIALLLMANVALGFFIPTDLAPGKVVRAIVILVLFTSAYVAEIVRGGLQSVPIGQIEAGRALGLSPVSVTRLIVLPQALRNVIPALVGQFISLFKDTTLAGAAMGLTDLLAGPQASTAQPAFRGQGLIAETLVFVLLIFWAGSYTMSNESQRLEARLGVGER